MSDRENLYNEIRDALHGDGNLIDSLEIDIDSSKMKSLSDIFHTIKLIAGEAEEKDIFDIAYKTANFIDLLRTTKQDINRAKLIVIEDSRDLITHSIDGIEIHPDSIIDWNKDITDSLKKKHEDISEVTSSSPFQYKIYVMFNEDAFKSKIDPIDFLSEIASYGKLKDQRLDKNSLPEYQNLNPKKCYLSWNCILETTTEYHILKDVLQQKKIQGKFYIEL